MGQGVPAGLVLLPLPSRPPGEMVMVLALHGVFRASLSFGPCTLPPPPARQGFSTYREITSDRMITHGVWL